MVTDSSAPNPEADAAGEPSVEPRRAPWRGRKRSANPLDKVLRIRCSTPELAELDARARKSGLSIGGFVRAVAFGSAGPRAVKRPTVEKEQLARLLGEIGKLGSNVNQIARHVNATRDLPTVQELDEMRSELVAMRAELMRALGRGGGE